MESEAAAWTNDASNPDGAHLSQGEDPDGIADSFLGAYQKYLRRPSFGDCGACAFEPSCSIFARQAVRRYSLVGGLALTLDRLFIRELARADSYYPKTCVDGHERFYDPIP